MSAGAARSFRTLQGEGRSELEIKRSRFLGRAAPVRGEAAVQVLLAASRGEHREARHHAFAYRLGHAGAEGRFSDDGEPGGTAGRPLMEVLQREDLVDAAVVVTRYWGGILLGAGGLTRAYAQAAAEAVRAAPTAAMRPHTLMRMIVAYAHFGALERLLQQYGLVMQDMDYAEHVALSVPVPVGDEGLFRARLADLTAGSAVLTAGATVFLPE